jgi:hypothetical protein
VPLGFSTLHAGDFVEEVSTMLPLLDSIGTKMLKLEEVVGGQLEVDGGSLAKAVAEYVLHASRARTPRSPLSWWCKGPSWRRRRLPMPTLRVPLSL